MAVPRPLLLALIGVVLLAVTFMATRNSQDETSSLSIPAAKTPEPAALKQSKTDAPAAKPEPAQAAKTEARQATEPKSESASTSAKADEPKTSSAKRERVTGAAAVERALDRKRIVVLAFFQPGADDRATRAAVNALSARQAAVFAERLGNIGRYRDLIGSLGVSQAPAVVIIDRERHARVVEGYVDAETLAQEVTDARR